MNKKFNSGISQALIYYASGFIIAWLVYMLWGKQTNTLPGPHHIVFILFITGGIIWMYYYFALALAKQKYKINYGSLTVHILSMISTIICALLLL